MSTGSKTRLGRNHWMLSSTTPSAAVKTTATTASGNGNAPPLAYSLGQRFVDEHAQHAVLHQVRPLRRAHGSAQEQQKVDEGDA